MAENCDCKKLVLEGIKKQIDDLTLTNLTLNCLLAIKKTTIELEYIVSLLIFLGAYTVSLYVLNSTISHSPSARYNLSCIQIQHICTTHEIIQSCYIPFSHCCQMYLYGREKWKERNNIKRGNKAVMSRPMHSINGYYTLLAYTASDNAHLLLNCVCGSFFNFSFTAIQ